jgi:hypothetical protein
MKYPDPNRWPTLIAVMLCVCVFAWLVAGCASLPLKDQAVSTYQASASILQNVQQAERAICNPTIAAPAPSTPGAGAAAEAAQLTTERHRAFVTALSKAAGLGVTAGDALKAWKAGDPVPKSFEDYVAAVKAVLTEASALAPAQAGVQKVTSQLQQMIDDLAKVRADLTKT